MQRLYRNREGPEAEGDAMRLTDTQLARFHEDGTRNLRKRQVIGKLDRDALTETITVRLSKHIDDAMEKI